MGRGADSLKARAVFGRDPALILQQKVYLLQIQAANATAVVAIDDVGGAAIYMPPDQCGHRVIAGVIAVSTADGSGSAGL